MKSYNDFFDKYKEKPKLIFLYGTLAIAVVSVFINLFVFLFNGILARSPFEAFNNEIVNLAFHLRDSEKPADFLPKEDIVIIDIDDESIEKLGRVNWWPRAFEAEIINYVSSANPKAIILDEILTESDSVPSYYEEILDAGGIKNSRGIISSLSTDQNLSAAIKTSGKVYLTMFDNDVADPSAEPVDIIKTLPRFQTDKKVAARLIKIKNPVFPIKSFATAAKGIGSINIPSDMDGTVRGYPLFQSLPFKSGDDKSKQLLVANISMLVAVDALGLKPSDIVLSDKKISFGEKLDVPVNKNGQLTINWLSKNEKFRSIPFHKVLLHKVPSEFFEGKYIFIGTSAAGLQDLKNTVAGSKVPGVIVHATAFYNLMNKQFIYELNTGYVILFWFILSLLLTAIFFQIKPVYSSLLSIAVTLIFSLIYLFYLFPHLNLVFPVYSFISITFITFIITFLYRYFTEEREKKKILKAFSSYVSPDVVEMITNNKTSLNLKGEKKKLTVLFSDIRGFTSFSENANPQTVVAFLNYYLSFMTEVIFEFKGTIDKFMGDGIMVIFGAPLTQSDNAMRACTTALRMINELTTINEYLLNQNLKGITIGVGVNTGDMTVGNIGSDKKFDYTVVGDAVNLGSRIEGLNKFFGTSILLSEYTKEHLPSDTFVVREIGAVRVKGKGNSVVIFELMDYGKNLIKYELILNHFGKGLAKFREQSFEDAKASFKEVLKLRKDDGPSLFYIEHCDLYTLNPGQFSSVFSVSEK